MEKFYNVEIIQCGDKKNYIGVSRSEVTNLREDFLLKSYSQDDKFSVVHANPELPFPTKSSFTFA